MSGRNRSTRIIPQATLVPEVPDFLTVADELVEPEVRDLVPCENIGSWLGLGCPCLAIGCRLVSIILPQPLHATVPS
ncbi:MAG: hypothetical protein ACW98Y_13740 [Candidatus Thorarchaeota archaeon]